MFMHPRCDIGEGQKGPVVKFQGKKFVRIFLKGEVVCIILSINLQF